MAPRKKAAKAAAAATTRAPPDPVVDDKPADEDISRYPEVQQDEFLATQAIYPDDFVRVHGRTEAWKNYENLAFQVRLQASDNPEYFVKLEIEFPKDYPKVALKAKIIAQQTDLDNSRTQLEALIKDVTKSHLGSECVYDITAAVEELLSRAALSKAQKVNPFSLEEERAEREAAAKLSVEQQEAQKLQQQEAARQQLLSKVDSERKQQEANVKPGATRTRTEMPVPSFPFPRGAIYKIPHSSQIIVITNVEGQTVMTRRIDKIIRLVSPSFEDESDKEMDLPPFQLKEIIIQKELLPSSEMTTAMHDIEQMLVKSFYKLWILTEYATQGSLESLLYLTQSLQEERVREFTRQILSALGFYQNQGHIHPALHIGNVLLFRLQDESDPTIKLSDGYGTALRKLVDDARAESVKPDLPPLWIAPELRKKTGQQVQETALWNLGIIVLQMHQGTSVVQKYTSPGDCLRKINFSRDFSDFLAVLFQENPRHRTTPEQLTAHAFLFNKGPLMASSAISTAFRPAVRKSERRQYSRWAEEWEPLGVLGSGSFGKVYKARKVADQTNYAVKLLMVSEKAPLDRTDFNLEVMKLALLQHPGVCRYYDAWTEEVEDTDEDVTSDDGNDDNYRVPPSLTGRNHEAVDQLLYESMMANQDVSIVQPAPRRLMSMSVYDPPGFGRNGFEPFERDPEQELSEQIADEELSQSRPVQQDLDQESSDSSDDDESSPPHFDNDDDYDNAYNNANGEIDPQDLLGVEFSDKNQLVGGEVEFGNSTNNVSKVDNQQSPPPSSDHNKIPRRRPSRITKGNFFIQMELCDNETLKNVITAKKLYEDPDKSWRLMRNMLEALKYIHQSGITHRDLKPSNIFIDMNGNPKIGDFGLATTAMSSEAHGFQAGTELYMAPESLLNAPIKELQKTDMYSMGLIFFEMNSDFATESQRLAELVALRDNPSAVLSKWTEIGREKQKAVVLSLLNGDQTKRPTAAELLESGDIPEPLEQEKLDRRLEYLANNEPDKVGAMLKVVDNSDVRDLAWDSTETGSDSSLPIVLDDIRSRLRGIFRKHGAVGSTRQPLVPKAPNTAADAVLVFNSSIMRFQLIQDPTTPFARSIAKSKPRFRKFYSFDSSFHLRNAPKTADAEQIQSINSEPKQTLEANFDLVSYKDTDLALKEASTIYLIKEIIVEFPVLASGEWVLLLNHMDLLDLILEESHIRAVDRPKVKDALANIPRFTMPQKQKRNLLSTADRFLQNRLNIDATSVAILRTFVFVAGDSNSVRAELQKLFGKKGSSSYSKALRLLRRLDDIIDHLRRFNFGIKVQIVPTFNVAPRLYNGSICFQCVEKKDGVLLAHGGRYDGLIEHHARANAAGDPTTRAVGLRVGLEGFAAILQSFAAAGGKNSSTSSNSNDSGRASRCSVLVTSFDAKLLASTCIDVVQKIWAVGVGAELTEEVESMDALTAMHEHDGPYWLVIVRMGAERPSAQGSVAGWWGAGGVAVERVGEFLEVELAREKKGR
ncbi:Serine/threonine-protein kinase GCN2 [Cyphellophora attinorum]|uniref:non-specific serine/threonine protein kinase n=1 Tax=Cyphellophora attinorum TaxID=1664694 RepID=A0A0N1HCF4_9EURO|nr:Serine/threonine-protein kinase GCN2 [Phialophora attinorum]KPI42363.1 Serine/threonine-protein kinase GCN2 [Phialophora attinorum]